MKVLPLVCGRGGRGTFFTPKMGHFFNIFNFNKLIVLTKWNWIFFDKIILKNHVEKSRRRKKWLQTTGQPSPTKIKSMTLFGVKQGLTPPHPHTSDRIFILHRNSHFGIEEQNCQISFLKNNLKI